MRAPPWWPGRGCATFMDVCWRPLIFQSSSPPSERRRLTGVRPSVGKTRAGGRSLVIPAAHRIRNKRMFRRVAGDEATLSGARADGCEYLYAVAPHTDARIRHEVESVPRAPKHHQLRIGLRHQRPALQGISQAVSATLTSGAR